MSGTQASKTGHAVNEYRGLRVVQANEGAPQQERPPLCKFYARGFCANGRACRFYHPPNPLDTENISNAISMPPLSRPSASSFLIPTEDESDVSRPMPATQQEANTDYVDFSSAYATVFSPEDTESPGTGADLDAQNSNKLANMLSSKCNFLTTVAEERENSYAGAASRAVGVSQKAQTIENEFVSREDHWRSVAANFSQIQTQVLCKYHADGRCRYGESCMYIHGSFCNFCFKNVLHPTDNSIAGAHIEQCRAESERQAKLASNGNVECGICYENPSAQSRKFGLLQNCEHAFCLQCIRSWRGAECAESFGREAVRTCPLCRVESFMVIPSDSFESNPEVKNQLAELYKAKLRLIPCKHFAFGDGSCPFGTSCYYSHVDRDGKEPDENATLVFSEYGSKLKSVPSLADYL